MGYDVLDNFCFIHIHSYHVQYQTITTTYIFSSGYPNMDFFLRISVASGQCNAYI